MDVIGKRIEIQSQCQKKVAQADSMETFDDY